MRLLLDTHTFIWFIEGNPELSNSAKSLIEDSENERLLSIASLWEIAIKTSLGRLNLNTNIQQLVDNHVYGNAIALLPIAPSCLGRRMGRGCSRNPSYHLYDGFRVALPILQASTFCLKP